MYSNLFIDTNMALGFRNNLAVKQVEIGVGKLISDMWTKWILPDSLFYSRFP